jgi:methylated-DNA-[protein]-cysteine S-methyltransferase
MYSFACDSPIGLLFVSVTGNGLRRLDVFSSQQDIERHPRLAGEHLSAQGTCTQAEADIAAKVEMQLTEYFEGARRDFNLPLDVDTGSQFQRRVWRAIADIPYGHVASYANVALAAGAPGAFRAAGSACGNNPVAIVTPCHRVVASGNRLGGYGLGLDNKVWLLNLEGVACSGTKSDSRVIAAHEVELGR